MYIETHLRCYTPTSFHLQFLFTCYVSAFSGGIPVLNLDSGIVSDKTMAHMSMATRQYLEKHNLIRIPQVAGGLEEESGTTELSSDGERILDVKRLKTLPKLF